jgi:hypothetical protein
MGVAMSRPMRALVFHASVCLAVTVSACAALEEDVEPELGGSYDRAPDAVDGEQSRLLAASVFPPPNGWSYDIYRDVSVTIRSSCLPGGCAPDDKRELYPPPMWGGRIVGDTLGWVAQFKWKWYPGELDPRTGQPYPSWVPIHPYFAVDFFWGCADTPGGGPVNDYAPCQGGPNQMWTTSGVASYGAPYNTSGRYFDGHGNRACWDLPATSSPQLGTYQCHLGPNQQFQFSYSCAVEGESCSTDKDCCYRGAGGCGSGGTCLY